MNLEPERLQAAFAALGGGVCFGLFHLATTLLSGQPIAQGEALRALVNVAFGVIVGVLAGYFVAPTLTDMTPWVSMRDPHVAGFAIGAGAWISWPFLKAWLETVLAARARGPRP